ncbi:MAG: RNase H family protein [Candidatus Binatia bacterium]
MKETVAVTAFTDGAAKGNPGPGGWGAVLLIGDGAVRELGASGGATTNNRMEITAAAASLEWLADSADAEASVTIVTDSSYVLRGVTEWMSNWKRRGWKTTTGGDVANRDLWERLDRAVQACGRVRWRHVPGHAGYPGNERADEIASEYALARPPLLYAGSYEGYPHDLRRLPAPGSPIRSASKTGQAGQAGNGGKRGKGGAHSYVSLVDGVALTHSTWAECERRVKGRSGARFRKTVSAADERALLTEWGARLDDPGGGR